MTTLKTVLFLLIILAMLNMIKAQDQSNFVLSCSFFGTFHSDYEGNGPMKVALKRLGRTGYHLYKDSAKYFTKADNTYFQFDEYIAEVRRNRYFTIMFKDFTPDEFKEGQDVEACVFNEVAEQCIFKKQFCRAFNVE